MLPSVDIPNIPAAAGIAPTQNSTPPVAAPDTISFSSRPNTSHNRSMQQSSAPKTRSPPTARISRRITLHSVAVPMPPGDTPAPLRNGGAHEMTTMRNSGGQVEDSPPTAKSTPSTTTTNQSLSWQEPGGANRNDQNRGSKSKSTPKR